MGVNYVEVTIRNPGDSTKSWTAPFFVDAKTWDSLVPRDQLEAIGLKPKRRRQYTLTDGRKVDLDITTAELEFMGEVVGGTVVYSGRGSQPVLGSLALKSGGFEVDQRCWELRRTPPILLGKTVS